MLDCAPAVHIPGIGSEIPHSGLSRCWARLSPQRSSGRTLGRWCNKLGSLCSSTVPPSYNHLHKHPRRSPGHCPSTHYQGSPDRPDHRANQQPPCPRTTKPQSSSSTPDRHHRFQESLFMPSLSTSLSTSLPTDLSTSLTTGQTCPKSGTQRERHSQPLNRISQP